jgi:tyrosyl-tRNA synthetase
MTLLPSAAMAPEKQVDARSQLEILVRNAAEVIPEDELLAKLERSGAQGRPLRVKLGIDPSRPDLHLGHSVVLRKLREFQDFGHTAVLIIGDFTGLVGDPSGQSETRPMLTPDEMAANAKTYFDQAGAILEVERAEIRHNSEWLAPLTMADVLRLTATATVAQMLERDDFQARFRAGRPISVVELLYPLMQAMDSVAVEADVEMGGTDQTFNLLMGRDLQRERGQEPQVVFTMPLIEGTDGKQKMSKSLDNYVGITEPPDEMFGKLMRIPDELIVKYLRLCTELPEHEVVEIEVGLPTRKVNPAEAKRRMARAVVALYHGERAASAAEQQFDRVHRDRQFPEAIPEVAVPAEAVANGQVFMPRLLPLIGLATSGADARRLMLQGAVRVDGKQIKDPLEEFPLESLIGRVAQVGRRKFVRLVQPEGE